MSQGKYEKHAAELGRLVDLKEQQYGASWKSSADVLRVYFPDGIPVEAYTDALLLVRVLDKLSRIAQRHRGVADGESPWLDVEGYGALGAVKDEELKAAKQP